jgi:hypothetical protein
VGYKPQGVLAFWRFVQADAYKDISKTPKNENIVAMDEVLVTVLYMNSCFFIYFI